MRQYMNIVKEAFNLDHLGPESAARLDKLHNLMIAAYHSASQHAPRQYPDSDDAAADYAHAFVEAITGHDHFDFSASPARAVARVIGVAPTIHGFTDYIQDEYTPGMVKDEDLDLMPVADPTLADKSNSVSRKNPYFPA